MKLKAFVTQSGFFELAVAVPTKKAAIETLGISNHAFDKGFAKQTQDPKIIDAVMAKPGVVLKRTVGSKGAFTENAALPKLEEIEKKSFRKAKKARTPSKAEQAARRQKEAAKHRAEKRREKAVTALRRAEQRHDKILVPLRAEQSRLNERIEREERRWDKERATLSKNLM